MTKLLILQKKMFYIIEWFLINTRNFIDFMLISDNVRERSDEEALLDRNRTLNRQINQNTFS